MTDSTLPALKSDLFRALAHPTRIRLLELLQHGEHTVQALQLATGLDQPVVSQHLAALRAQALVTVRRVGTQAYYSLRDPLVAELLRVSRTLLTRRLADSRLALRELAREQRRG